MVSESVSLGGFISQTQHSLLYSLCEAVVERAALEDVQEVSVVTRSCTPRLYPQNSGFGREYPSHTYTDAVNSICISFTPTQRIFMEQNNKHT